MFSGYVATGNPSYFDFGPMNSVLSFNTLENVRLRAGGMTTAALSKRWFGRGFVAYGFKDHRWKYSAEAEYSFIDKEYHSREFPVQSVRLTSSYNIEHPDKTTCLPRPTILYCHLSASATTAPCTDGSTRWNSTTKHAQTSQ